MRKRVLFFSSEYNPPPANAAMHGSSMQYIAPPAPISLNSIM